MSDGAQKETFAFDERKKRWPTLEPLALRIIRNYAEASDEGPHLLRKLNSLYLALVQIVTMNGQGTIIRTNLVEEFSGVSPNDHRELKDALTKMQLVRFTTEHKVGEGNRKRVYCELLDAPYQGNTAGSDSRNGDEPNPNQHQPPPASPPGSDSRNVKVSKATSSEESTAVDSSSEVPEYEKPEQHYDKRYGPRSLKGWSRSDIAAWHQANPNVPPPGCSYTQAMQCAISTTPGFDAWIAQVEGGFDALSSWLHRYLHNALGGYRLRYQDWMRGALSFDRMPAPKDGPPTLQYWIAALRDEAATLRGRATEEEHLAAKKRGWVDAGDETITVEEVLAMRKQMVAEGVLA